MTSRPRPPRPKDAKTPPFDLSPEEIAARMLRRVLALEDGDILLHELRWSSDWKDRRTDLDGKRMEIREDHAEAAIASGLVEVAPDISPTRLRLTAAGVQAASPLVGRVPLDVRALVEDVLDTVLFNPSDAIEGRTAIPAIYDPSKKGSKVVLVLGENAAGKSLFRRVVQQTTHRGSKGQGFGERDIPRGPFPVGEVLHLSMQGRTGSTFGTSMVYGEESYHSTGENSAGTIRGAIRTASGRNHTTIVYWDEPDIGMSAGAAAGAGVAIREFVEKDVSPLTEAVFVTSHSPSLIHQLAALDPHYLFLGNAVGPPSLADWFTWQQNPPPISPEELQDLSHKRFRDIQAVLNANKLR